VNLDDGEIINLGPVEGRVLGCLLEKERTTPDNYPLTLNSVRLACNQASSRDPVVTYDEATVADALASLRQKQLIRIVHSPSNRAAKYRHVVDEVLELGREELAVLCLLLLRGPQTLGELRTRSERLAEFSSLTEVQAVLDRLAGRQPPLVRMLDRQPGQKEARVAQLLAEEVGGGASAEGGESQSTDSPSAAPVSATGVDRVSALESDLDALRGEVSELRRAVEELCSSLGVSPP